MSMMDLKRERLLDSHSPIKCLEHRWVASCYADDGGTDDGSGGSGDDDVKDDNDDVKDETSEREIKALEAKRKVDAQNKRIKAELAELKKKQASDQEELEKYRQSQMTEVELAKKQAEDSVKLASELKTMLEQEKAARTFEQHMRIVAVSGVSGEVQQKFVAAELGQYLAENDEPDVETWMEKFKEENPAFFGVSETQAPRTAGGHARPGNSDAGKEARIKQLEEEIKVAQMNGIDGHLLATMQFRLEALKRDVLANP